MTTFGNWTLELKNRAFVVERPLIMGIINATPDSFYSASRALVPDLVAQHARQMVADGVDIIDIGALSTRPGADLVSVRDEMTRLKLAVNAVKSVSDTVLTSVDTFRADVACFAVEELGVDIVNDISGGTLDNLMFPTVARLGVPYIMMHMRGTPATMQQMTDYGGTDVVDAVIDQLQDGINRFRETGGGQVIVDPGLGFAKTVEQNYCLLNSLDRLVALGHPVLVGASRKSMIYKVLDCTPEDALNGTTVVNTIALVAGAHILRVHDVRAAVETRTLVMKTLNCT